MTDKEIVYELIKRMGEEILYEDDDVIDTKYNVFEFIDGKLDGIYEAN